MYLDEENRINENSGKLTLWDDFKIFPFHGNFTQYCSGDKIEKNEMGGACNACGGEQRRMQGFGGETWGKETTWETQM